MRVLLASSEAVPFAKTGGLADVAGALPEALRDAGHEAALIMPLYREARASVARLAGRPAAEVLREVLVIPDLTKPARVLLLAPELAGGPRYPVYFVECDALFDRDRLYGHADEAERFILFSRVLAAFAASMEGLDVLHANDWQCALAPALLRAVHASSLPTVLTIHNLAYQGRYDKSAMELTGLGWSLFTVDGLEFWDDVNLLKGGIIFADAVTTVSPTYAREIQTPEYGCGLDGVLRDRAADLYGILNGADYGVWDPTTDEAIVQQYDATEPAGKAACKRELQQLLELEVSAELPVIGMVTRLAEQKGLDIVADAISRLMSLDVEMVILGTGDEHFHRLLPALRRRYPGRFHTTLGFDDVLAHRIYAGSDMFLVPSRFEPCGLSQLYAMRYGSLPVVRRTGGLADTVVDGVTGFSFADHTAEELVAAVARAATCFRDDQPRWRGLVQAAMAQDFSWAVAAAQYTDLYARLTE